jgi:hypothetical protein
LAIWQLGNLATCFQLWKLSKLGTFNFGNFQFWQLLILAFSILATFNFGNFQFW